MGGSPTLLLSGCWWYNGLALPQSGCSIPIVEEESVGEITGRWDQKDGVHPPNHLIRTLGDGGMSPTPLSPFAWYKHLSPAKWK